MSSTVRRIPVVILAVLMGVLMLPATRATAATADRPNSFTAAKSAAASRVNTWLYNAISTRTDVDWYKFNLPAGQYVWIRLGNLPNNYRLQVVNAAGRLISTSDRPGRQFEELYSYLPAGTWYVRVSGNGYASPAEAMLRFSPLKSTVQVLSSRMTTSYHFLQIQGEVLNNTASSVLMVRITARYYNNGGDLMGTEWTLADRYFLAPHQRSPFMIIDGHARTSLPLHYTLSVTAEPMSGAGGITGLVLVPASPYNDARGHTIYRGQVANPYGLTVGSVLAYVIRHNSLGGLLDYGVAVLPSVGAHRQATFTIPLPMNPAVNQISYGVYADYFYAN